MSAEITLPGFIHDLYSTNQNTFRGGQVYAVSCQTCHGDALQGDGTATALTGPGFMADFNGVTLGEMLDRTRTTMPDDNPGTMSRQQIADVLTYVLSVNKFPAGAAELPTQAEVLKQITFLATKPTSRIPHVSDHNPLEAVLKTWVPSATLKTSKILQASGSNRRLVKNTRPANAAIRIAARLA